MNTSVILSYAFIYFVLFLVVPLVLVTFTMTCIKFFKSDVPADEAEKEYELKGSEQH